jgi:cysteine-rich repeat protein
VQAGVEECDDGNDDTTDACLPVFCVEATCTDGYVQEGVEECDDGNEDDTDACPSTCEPAYCGDGFIQEGEEECDDGNDMEDDGCKPDCIAESMTWTFTDTNADDVTSDSLKLFFDSIPNPTANDYLFVEVQGAQQQGAYCLLNASWYISNYQQYWQGSGSYLSGNHNKWYRAGDQNQAWQGPVQTGQYNYYNNSCYQMNSWCVEWNLGARLFAPRPGNNAAQEVYASGYSNGNWVVTIRWAKTRIAACGF